MAATRRASGRHGQPGSSRTPDWDTKSRDLYLRLLRLLDVKVTVDVVSGTSAGGINAALSGCPARPGWTWADYAICGWPPVAGNPMGPGVLGHLAGAGL